MEVIEKSRNEIIPYEKNPRKNKNAIQYVAESIKKFGFKVPIIIDKNNVIVAGHTRYEASKLLKLKKIPCIIADDLTDEQVKAFRLADNKVSEYSEWDMDLLKDELSGIFDIKMSDFGFELFSEPDSDGFSVPKENERERTNDAYNLKLYDDSRVDGFYQMPIIKNDKFIPKKIVGFNYMLSSEEKDVGIHCFVDDYQFERLWNDPYKYLDEMGQYDCMLSPDFSLYMDMPMSMKIWNVYRSRLLGQFWQDNGIKVIPTLSWAEKETFAFCFDGIPEKSIVAISTIGVKKDENALKIWKDGMDAMIEKIKPSHILVYGGEIEYDYKNIKVTYYENQVTERMKEVNK